MKENVLIAEDDADIIELLTLYLTSNDYHVYSAQNGRDALEMVRSKKIDIALVDVMMPEMNGFEFIQAVRLFSDIPIMIISAKNMDIDKVLGLNIGADAYLTKPFNPLEVIAYIRALLRRYQRVLEAPKQEESTLTIGDLTFDVEKFVLKKNGQILPLTLTELKIVLQMMKSPERVFTKAQLYECINGEVFNNDDNTMMVHISNIRSKIEDDPSNPRYIKTVRGLGYKIEDHL